MIQSMGERMLMQYVNAPLPVDCCPHTEHARKKRNSRHCIMIITMFATAWLHDGCSFCTPQEVKYFTGIKQVTKVDGNGGTTYKRNQWKTIQINVVGPFIHYIMPILLEFVCLFLAQKLTDKQTDWVGFLNILRIIWINKICTILAQ